MRKRRERLSDIGELEAIRRLTRGLVRGSGVVVGPGDDCAVVAPGRRCRTHWLLTSDPIIERVHFTAEARPESIGHKAVGRILSDLAAMGGEPDWALIDLVAPGGTAASRLERIYDGAARLADRYGLSLVGGDLAEGLRLELHVFGVGHLPAGSALLRSGARENDAIYVTGRLGGSSTGRHLTFEPRVPQGLWLRTKGWARAMIDISDGLATDLRHILDMSGVGAELDLARIPIAPAARRIKGGKTPLDHALYDGEDFELLFTVAPDRERTFASAWRRKFDLPCTRIGRITGSPSTLAVIDASGGSRIIARSGYEHFVRGKKVAT